MASILLQPYCPELTGKVLDFLCVKERSLKFAKIDFNGFQKEIKLDLNKKKEMFVGKIEAEGAIDKTKIKKVN